MKNGTTLSDLAVNAQADVFGALMDGGSIELYGGELPISADWALPETQVLAARLTLPSPAFGPATIGTLIAKPIRPTIALEDCAKLTFGRIRTADGRVVMDVTVGLEADNPAIVLPSLRTFRDMTQIGVTFFSHTVDKICQD